MSILGAFVYTLENRLTMITLRSSYSTPYTSALKQVCSRENFLFHFPTIIYSLKSNCTSRPLLVVLPSLVLLNLFSVDTEYKF